MGEKKIAIKKFDPALTAIAVRELMVAKRVEKGDVEAAKAKIKEIYNALPATKNRAEIISKALDEANSEIIAEEIKKIKTELADLDKDEFLEIGKELSAVAVPECPSDCVGYDLGCGDCINYFVVACNLKYCISYNVIYCPACITYQICSLCIGHQIICQNRCIQYNVGCHYQIVVCQAPIVAHPIAQIDPALKETIVEAVVDDPRLSKAMRKLIAEMKKNGEI